MSTLRPNYFLSRVAKEEQPLRSERKRTRKLFGTYALDGSSIEVLGLGEGTTPAELRALVEDCKDCDILSYSTHIWKQDEEGQWSRHHDIHTIAFMSFPSAQKALMARCAIHNQVIRGYTVTAIPKRTRQDIRKERDALRAVEREQEALYQEDLTRRIAFKLWKGSDETKQSIYDKASKHRRFAHIVSNAEAFNLLKETERRSSHAIRETKELNRHRNDKNDEKKMEDMPPKPTKEERKREAKQRYRESKKLGIVPNEPQKMPSVIQPVSYPENAMRLPGFNTYASDWFCPTCNVLNFYPREQCFKCKTPWKLASSK